MARPIHPLASIEDQQPDLFSGMSPDVIDFPDKASPIEYAYHQTHDLNADHAAQVFKTSENLGADPQYVADNLEAAKKAAAIPPSEYFADITDKYPATAKYLSDPVKMAVAKDDINNLASTENLVQGYSTGRTLWNSLQTGLAKLNVQLAKVPATVYDVAAFPQNFIASSLGHPELEVRSPEWLANNPVAKFYSDQAKAWTPPALEQSVTDLLKEGRVREAGTALSAQLIESAPSLALLMAASAAGYPGVGLGGVGVTSAGDVLARNRQLGVEPATASLNAMYHGAINMAFMNLGALSPLHKWEAAIAESVGSDTARKVVLDMAKTFAGSFASMGGSMAAITSASDFADYATGVNPAAMQGTWKRALDAWIVGGATGAALVGPAAIASGFARGTDVSRVQATRDFYTALGDTAEASKLRERLPENHRAFVEQLTKDSPVQNISIPAERFDTYFQGKNIDPDGIAKDLGIEAQLPVARQAGGDIQIPLSAWTEKMVGTPHYDALKDDIRFHPEDPTVNEAKEQAQATGEMVQAAADQAIKENPKLQEGRDFVYADLKRQLQSTGQVTSQQADAQAQLGAAMITKMAADRAMDPKDFYEKGPIKVVSGTAPTEAAAAQRILRQEGAVAPEPVPKDLPVVSEQAKTGEPHAVFVYNWQLDPSLPSTPYFRLYGDPDKIAALTKTPDNPSGNAWRSDVSLETVREAGIPIAGKSPEAKASPLFQGDPESDPRGFIQFTPKETLISLVKADASTFPHELAHYWLKTFHEFVQTGQASDRHLGDWKILSDWLKVEDGQKDLTKEQHEQFAKGFELYLREGKAPSEGLRGVFAKFRRWLTQLYRDPITLGVELNENVRGVMERMLASEDETAFVERSMGMDIGKEFEGIDPKVRDKLLTLREQAHEAAVTNLLNEQMAELTDEHRRNLVTEAANARVKAEDSIRSSPIQKTIGAIEKTFGRDPHEVAGDWRLGKLKPEENATLEQLAESRGYSSADELTYKVMNEPHIEKQIQAAVDQHMAQFADLKDSAKIREEALKAVYSEKQTDLLAKEQSIFRAMVDEAQGRVIEQKRRAAQAKIEAEVAQAKAKEVIAAKSVGEAGQFMPYFTAERNAALKVQKALLDKDYEAASVAKRQQMLNHALATEAFKARAEIDKAMRVFDRFASRKQDLKDIPYGFIRQIDTLLSDRGLAPARAEDAKTYLAIAQDMATKGEDPEEIAHRTGWVQDASGQWRQEALPDTVIRIQNDYRNVAIPDSVLTSPPVPYRQMSLSDFRDLKQAVQALNAVGRGYDRFLNEMIKMDRKEAAAKIREFIEQNIGQSYKEARDIGAKQGEGFFTKKIDSLLNLPNAAIPSLVNLYRICDFLDGFKPDGLMKNLLYRPLLHSDGDEITRNQNAVEAMNKILAQHWAKGEYEQLRKEKVYIASRDRDMTRDELMSFALNWGNENGRQRLRDGYQLTPDQEAEILGKITKQQWDYAQASWDYLHSYWPDIVAQQQKVAGETPRPVAPAEIETPYGKYAGGYYPLAYDSARSSEAYNNLEARNALYKTAGSVMAHTEQGFTKARVAAYAGPVKLDTRVMFNHLQDVVHDLAFRKSIIDVNGLLRQRDVREAVINAIGLDGYRTIEQHVKWVAADQGEPVGAADRILRRIRFGATMATLGFRPMTAPIFLASNAISAIKDIGPVGFAGAIKDFLADRETNVAFVDQNSPRMAKRSSLRDRDLADMAKRWQGEDSLLQHFAFYPHNKADQAITYPLWLQVYRGTVAEFGQQKAVDMADEAVMKLAGSGSPLDLAMIQRGSEGHKIFTWWYSWAGTQFNRMWADGKLAGLEYDKGNIGTALTVLATSAFFGWVLQGANENLWREFFRNAQGEDDEKKTKRMTERMIMQGISYVPIIRELAQYGLGKVMGQPSDIQLPFQEAVKTVVNPLADMAQAALTDKSLSPRFWENTAKEAAIGAAYPQYLNTLAFNFLDYLNGQGDLTWRDLLSRRTKT